MPDNSFNRNQSPRNQPGNNKILQIFIGILVSVSSSYIVYNITEGIHNRRILEIEEEKRFEDKKSERRETLKEVYTNRCITTYEVCYGPDKLIGTPCYCDGYPGFHR